MPIDPSIALGLQPSKPIDYLGAYGNALTLKNLMGQQELQGLQLQQARREADKQMRLSDLARASGGDIDKFLTGMAEVDPIGAYELGMKNRKTLAELAKTGMEGRKLALESADKFSPIYLRAAQFVKSRGYTPEAVAEAKQFMLSSGVPSDLVATVPNTVTPEYVDGVIKSNMSFADQLAREQEERRRFEPQSTLGKQLRDWYLAERTDGTFEPPKPISATQADPDAVDGEAMTSSANRMDDLFSAAIRREALGPADQVMQYDPNTGRPVVVPEAFKAQEQLRRAGATNIKNVVGTQETETAKTIGKGVGEDYITIQRAEFASRRRVDRVSRLQNLLQDVDTGKLTPIGTQLAGYARSLGFDIDPKLGNKEAAIALENEIALELRNPSGGAGMPGAMSDSDRRFLQNMAAFTDKTPKGRALMVETLKRIADRDAQVAKMAREYMKRNGGVFDQGFYDELAVFGAANPLFPTQEQIDAELKKRRR